MIVIRKKIFTLGLVILFGGLLGTALWKPAVGKENLPVRNLEFINVDLRQVFRSLAAIGRFNVILGQAVKGNVSIAFKSGIAPQEAVAVIAKNYGYQYQWLSDSKAVVVGDAQSFAGNLGGKTLVDIPLKYIDAATAAGSLEMVISKERIKPDSGGHKLIVFGNSLELQNVNEIIAKIDRPLSSVNVEVKVAEVADDFWRKLGMDSKVIRSHIGIYPVSASLENGLTDPNIIQPLTRQNLTLFDNQEGKLVFGDKIGNVNGKSNNPSGPGSSAAESLDMGTTMRITFWVGEGNKITLQVTETTLTPIATPTTALSKNGADFSPGFGSREVTSIISMEAGQMFILTGMIGRDEFNRLKKTSGVRGPRNYPVLSELFAVENSPPSEKKDRQVIAMITPNFSGDLPKQDMTRDDGHQTDAAFRVDSNQNSEAGSARIQQGTLVEDAKEKTANVADKTEVDTDSAMVSSQPVNSNDANDSVSIMEYLVKPNDTITSIGAKFNLEPRAIIAANQWDNPNPVIRINSWILIPVPKNRIYEIKPKETLWRIAKRYGTTVELLKDLNDIPDIEKVKAGQKIVLPVAFSHIIDPRF
jgi:LysM repeat protein